MGDVQSGMASTVIQVYLKAILESLLNHSQPVRLAALSVVILILRQGLVHPVQCVPYLICMGTDCDSQIRGKADLQISEIDKKYSGFIQVSAVLRKPAEWLTVISCMTYAYVYHTRIYVWFNDVTA